MPETKTEFDLHGWPELRDWLDEQGFRFQRNIQSEHNRCNWLAWRRSDIDAVPCETNGTPAQIIIKPAKYEMHGTTYESVRAQLRGEQQQTWYDLTAYGLSFDALKDRLPEIERSLVFAWNALDEALLQAEPDLTEGQQSAMQIEPTDE